MGTLAISGIPAIAWAIGFVVVGSLPVWLGAKITGAERPTLLRSALALIVGTIGSVVGMAAGMPLALIIAPLSFLLAFKFILDTSFFGALMLGIVAVIGYFLMAKFIGGGFSVNENPDASALRHSAKAAVVVAQVTHKGTLPALASRSAAV